MKNNHLKLSHIHCAPPDAPGDVVFRAGAPAHQLTHQFVGGTISFLLANGTEMLRLSEDGVYVLGEPAPYGASLLSGFWQWVEHAMLIHGRAPEPASECHEQALHWIARMPCGRAPEDDLLRRLCADSGDPVAEWCASCYARGVVAGDETYEAEPKTDVEYVNGHRIAYRTSIEGCVADVSSTPGDLPVLHVTRSKRQDTAAFRGQVHRHVRQRPRGFFEGGE